MNALSTEVQQIRALYDTVFDLKATRARLESLGVATLTDPDYQGAGDLNHLSAQKVQSLLAAMDVLDAAFLTPADLAGVTAPPIKAMVDVIR
jgi:hypothetical protein